MLRRPFNPQLPRQPCRDIQHSRHSSVHADVGMRPGCSHMRSMSLKHITEHKPFVWLATGVFHIHTFNLQDFQSNPEVPASAPRVSEPDRPELQWVHQIKSTSLSRTNLQLIRQDSAKLLYPFWCWCQGHLSALTCLPRLPLDLCGSGGPPRWPDTINLDWSSCFRFGSCLSVSFTSNVTVTFQAFSQI